MILPINFIFLPSMCSAFFNLNDLSIALMYILESSILLPFAHLTMFTQFIFKYISSESFLSFWKASAFQVVHDFLPHFPVLYLGIIAHRKRHETNSHHH